MVFQNLKLRNKYDLENEAFQAAFQFLQREDLESLGEGNYPILGEDVFAMVQSFETAREEERRFEAHDIYFDIQYLLEGEERIDVIARSSCTVTENPEGKDICFLEAKEKFSQMLLRKGDFLILSPEEAHRPAVAANQPRKCKKIVVKVRALKNKS